MNILYLRREYNISRLGFNVDVDDKSQNQNKDKNLISRKANSVLLKELSKLLI